MNIKVVSISAPKLLYIGITEDAENQNDEKGCQVMISGVSLNIFYYSVNSTMNTVYTTHPHL